MISSIVGIALGVFSAVRSGKVDDYLLRSVAILSLSIPSFAIGTLVLVLPAIYFRWVPPLGYTPFAEDPVGNISGLLLPSVVLGLAIAGAIMRFTRTMMLDVLRQDYVRTAKAKGLKGSAVLSRHAVKNALIPVVTLLGLQIAAALGGSVIIEQLFSLPGLGQLLLTAINQRDYTVVQGVTVVIGLWVVVINLIVDLSYGVIDPRVRVGRGAS
jgi:peptide/nickel transport system permease protein